MRRKVLLAIFADGKGPLIKTPFWGLTFLVVEIRGILSPVILIYMGLLSSRAMMLKNGLRVLISCASRSSASNSEKTLMYLMLVMLFTKRLVFGPRFFVAKYEETRLLIEMDFPA